MSTIELAGLVGTAVAVAALAGRPWGLLLGSVEAVIYGNALGRSDQ